MKFLLAFFLLFLPISAQAGETYDRVMKSGEIRCGYAVWPPSFSVNHETNEFEGIFHDLMEEIGTRLSLNIEWVEEFGWGTAIEGMVSKRYDIACANFWPNPERARLVHFSIPVNYSPLHAWVNPESALLGKIKDSQELNNENITFVSVDGTTPNQIIRKYFPRAKNEALPELTPLPDQLYGVSTGKWDVAVLDLVTAHTFLENNPGKIVKLLPDHPVVVKPNVVLLPADDMRFSNMINHTIDDIIADGTYNTIVKKYNATELYLPLAKPYAVSE